VEKIFSQSIKIVVRVATPTIIKPCQSDAGEWFCKNTRQFTLNFQKIPQLVLIMTTVVKSARQATFLVSLSLSIVFSIPFMANAQTTQKPAIKQVPAVTTQPAATTPATSQSKAAPLQTGIVTHSKADEPVLKPTGLTGKIEAVGDQTKLTQGIVSKYRGGWQMFLQNPCRTGNSAVELAPVAQGKARWTFPAEGPIDSSPAIYKGVIYVGSDDGHVYAIDEQNGRMIWRSKLGDKVKSSPAVGDGMLIVGCEDKKIYGLDLKDGKQIWSHETTDRVSSSPAVYESTAYIGGHAGYVYALDTHTGKLKWQYPSAALTSSTVTPAADGTTEAAPAQPSSTDKIPTGLGRITSSPCLSANAVIVTSQDRNVYAISTRDGSLLWQFKTGGRLMASPMILDNTVYLGSWDNAFYAIDISTGKQRWKIGAPGSFSIAATGANGKIYAGNDDLKMYCLDAHTGRIMWKTQLNSPNPLLSSSPAIAGNMIYCGSTDGFVYAIDSRNGAIKWKFKTQRAIVSSPSVSPSGVCIGSQDGNLYLIN
jgi:outer membrane protein assembly factor BamB